jgi:Protein of unknown function (DUF2442)
MRPCAKPQTFTGRSWATVGLSKPDEFSGRKLILPDGLDIPTRLDAPLPESVPRAVQASTSNNSLTIELSDGRQIETCWSDLGTLRLAEPSKRLRFEVLDDGWTIAFPDLNEYVSVAGLLGYPD